MASISSLNFVLEALVSNIGRKPLYSPETSSSFWYSFMIEAE
jgi:hypothetical protein